MSHLPMDIVEEILFRVPAISLKRLGSTCKRWKLKESGVILASFSLKVDAPSIEFKVPLSLKDSLSGSVCIVDIFHCDDLLLCTTTRDNRIMFWNPCSGETRWIQIKPNYEGYSTFVLGQEQNSCCHSYKILRCYQPYNDDDKFGVFEIYELSSDSWRVLDVDTPEWFIKPRGVSLKGNAYWLASQNLKIVREEELAVLYKRYNTSKMEIWVTNNIDTEAALWIKSFTVDLETCSNRFLMAPRIFLIDEEKKVVVCSNSYDPSVNM
ncbi:hypothetical protein IGI04_025779 [Brassica rapa subsp. trilocularis]|uniref:F-box domain-containing protein n=1 Tax=Brassica rapa subsp. trilocularis TaxID=1813537 RepID=A0ABQ7KVD3_BRACM|nr:hypothetical protein IGI04_025779 [Brassica rapa subsp. trilocularis]